MKGCQKKVIYIKNTGSDIFEEAYFIVKEKNGASVGGDFIREANRIVDEFSCLEKKDNHNSLLKWMLVFGSGFILSCAILILILITF